MSVNGNSRVYTTEIEQHILRVQTMSQINEKRNRQVHKWRVYLDLFCISTSDDYLLARYVWGHMCGFSSRIFYYY